ncbi:hypothetical protein [Escherichia coli]
MWIIKSIKICVLFCFGEIVSQAWIVCFIHFSSPLFN